MIYGSVCSGIEAATAAWHSLGWRPSFFSEIEDFPRAVLQHHYPDVPLHGDFTTIEANQYEPINLLVGGTPCQSFSIAGLRGGLDDDRGNLALEFIRLAQRTRPKWIVWENVPGVLSSNRGRDFGTFITALGEIGYGFAYRVLDAQYFGVAQRRRRVFVVGYLGDWRRPAAVLFERESLFGNPAPSREEGQKVAGVTPFGIGERGETAHCLRAGASRADKHESTTYAVACNEVASAVITGPPFSRTGNERVECEAIVPMTARMRGFGDYECDGTASALKARDYKDATDLVAFPSNANADAMGALGYDISPSMLAGGDPPAVAAFSAGQSAKAGSLGYRVEQSPTLRGGASGTNMVPTILKSKGMAVRRLTPTECERLQGFPDGFTQIPYRNKPAEKCPDGPRYKALGNSMAVPVMRWIGERIQIMETCK